MSATLILVYILLIILVAVSAGLLITIGNKTILRTAALKAKEQNAGLKAQIDKQKDALCRGAKQIEDLVKAEGELQRENVALQKQIEEGEETVQGKLAQIEILQLQVQDLEKQLSKRSNTAHLLKRAVNELLTAENLLRRLASQEAVNYNQVLGGLQALDRMPLADRISNLQGQHQKVLETMLNKLTQQKQTNARLAGEKIDVDQITGGIDLEKLRVAIQNMNEDGMNRLDRQTTNAILTALKNALPKPWQEIGVHLRSFNRWLDGVCLPRPKYRKKILELYDTYCLSTLQEAITVKEGVKDAV